jgi:prepilin-type processing-associated H-X9-DG protein
VKSAKDQDTATWIFIKGKEIDQAKHGGGSSDTGGGSNYTFADGSARFMKNGTTLSPENLWGVTYQFRKILPNLKREGIGD